MLQAAAVPGETGVTPTERAAAAATIVRPVRPTAGAGARLIAGADGAFRAGAGAIFTGSTAAAVAEALAGAAKVVATGFEETESTDAAITRLATDGAAMIRATVVDGVTHITDRSAGLAVAVQADAVRADFLVGLGGMRAFPLGVADIPGAGVAIIVASDAFLGRMGASPFPVALVTGAGVAIVRAVGPGGLVADDAPFVEDVALGPLAGVARLLAGRELPGAAASVIVQALPGLALAVVGARHAPDARLGPPGSDAECREEPAEAEAAKQAGEAAARMHPAESAGEGIKALRVHGSFRRRNPRRSRRA